MKRHGNLIVLSVFSAMPLYCRDASVANQTEASMSKGPKVSDCDTILAESELINAILFTVM